MSHIYYSESDSSNMNLTQKLIFSNIIQKQKIRIFMVFRMNRVLSRPCLYLRQARSYRQDMPPPGGYAAIPWRRSIPTRGFGYIGVLISGYLILRGDYIAHQRYSHWRKQSMVSSRQANTFNNFQIFSSKQLTWTPLVCHYGKPRWTVTNSDLSNIKWKVSSDHLFNF